VKSRSPVSCITLARAVQTTATDSELLARIHVRDLTAFAELFGRYRITSLLAVQGRADGCEAVLAVWREVWHSPPVIEARTLTGWLRGELAHGRGRGSDSEATVPDPVSERRAEVRRVLSRAVSAGTLAKWRFAELC
jgi:hypothetical protein